MSDTQRDLKSPLKPLPKKGRTFNEWVDMVHNHVKEMNDKRYGINQPSTS